MWTNKSWILHHDNVPAHTDLSILQYLAKNNIPLLQKPPNSPDLVSCNFFVPKLKQIIEGTHFKDVEATKRTVTIKLKAIPEESFPESINA